MNRYSIREKTILLVENLVKDDDILSNLVKINNDLSVLYNKVVGSTIHELINGGLNFKSINTYLKAIEEKYLELIDSGDSNLSNLLNNIDDKVSTIMILILELESFIENQHSNNNFNIFKQ